jgi:predicted phage baseplate assembly protein
MTEHSCGCCEGTEPLTPLPTANRPGLQVLNCRVGTYGTFLQTMLAGLSGHHLDDGRRPLQRLTTRAPDDPALALLDAWAVIGDVLTFYQERVAGEGYLRTATERRSVLELARLVGYRLRPGVAASVQLAFTLEKDFEGEVPAGTGAQSIPAPGELPQTFETPEPLPARARWNAIPARQTRPTFLEPVDVSAPQTFFAQGVATNLRVNDTLLFVADTAQRPYTVREVATDADADHTIVTYEKFGAPPPATTPAVRPGSKPPATGAPLTRLGPVLAALRKEPTLPPGSRQQLPPSPQQTYSAASDLGPRLLTTLVPSLRDTLYTAYANAPLSAAPIPSADVQAMRVKAAPFGHNAPQELVFNDDNVPVERREWPLAEFETRLTVKLSATSGDHTVLQAFGEEAHPDAQPPTLPPLELDLTIADGSGAKTLRVALGDLERVMPARDQLYGRLFEPIKGVTVLVLAYYVSSNNSGYILQSIAAVFASGGGHFALSHEGIGALLSSGVPLRAAFFTREARVEGAQGATLTVGAADRQGSLGDTRVSDGTADGVILSAPTRTSGHVTVELAAQGAGISVDLHDRQLPTDGALLLSLDATYDRIAAGSWVVLHRPGSDPRVFRVQRVQSVSRVDYGISARVTQLVLDKPWLATTDTSLAVVRDVTAHAQSEALAPAEEPILDDVAGDTIELDGLYDGLEAGRSLVVTGERSDIKTDDQRVEGVPGSELVMLAGVDHTLRTVHSAALGHPIELPGDTLHTTLILSTPLAFRYRRKTLAVNANVVVATHGQTRKEVLGGGDGSQPFQRFTLKQPPLTHVAAPTADGVASTLEVRVNDIRWQERVSLLGLDADTRAYQTSADDDNKTSVIFGDGHRGARPPTGVENVTAVYRSGIGKGGNVAAKQISLLTSRPLGVKEVINPQRASGGADPESRDAARRNVPLASLALDRLVSVDDYASFTRRFAGIGKAASARLSDGRREVVHITIAGVDDAPIDRGSELHRNMLRTLASLGDPSLPIQVALREAIFVVISARIQVHPDHLWENVEPKIRAALLDTFGFDARDLGQDLLLSEVIGVIQRIEGVDYVDVDLLNGVSDTDATDPETLAAKLEELGAAAEAGGLPADRLTADLARVDATGAGFVIRPAQLAYLQPTLPDTLLLTDVTQ